MIYIYSVYLTFAACLLVALQSTAFFTLPPTNMQPGCFVAVVAPELQCCTTVAAVLRHCCKCKNHGTTEGFRFQSPAARCCAVYSCWDYSRSLWWLGVQEPQDCHMAGPGPLVRESYVISSVSGSPTSATSSLPTPQTYASQCNTTHIH